ncbi:MAG TPA: hypothetical protein VK204_00365 [Nocardioidaceae bacterium]|nr:hypothetical protein [Nocardioidaceae bacterium]
MPVVVGVCALLLASLLGYVTLRDTVFDDAAASSESHEYFSRSGGFSVTAPTALRMDAKGRTMKFMSQDKSLVINVGPGEKGSLKAADQRFLSRMQEGYRRFDLMATESMKVDGRPAVTSSGQATNANNVRIRFVVVTVQAKPRNYTIAAYTAHDSDPTVVLPLVNAVANGFHVLP